MRVLKVEIYLSLNNSRPYSISVFKLLNSSYDINEINLLNDKQLFKITHEQSPQDYSFRLDLN
jgi:hypothetical protein